MAWATTTIVPGQANLQVAYSLNQIGIDNDQQINITNARDSSTGGLFDFTAATTVNVRLDPASGDPVASNNIALAATLVSGGAGSLKLSMTAAAVTAAVKNKGGRNFAMTILTSDGSTTLLAATGTLTVGVTA